MNANNTRPKTPQVAALDLGPRQIRIPSRTTIPTSTATMNTSGPAQLRLRSQTESIEVLQEFILPAQNSPSHTSPVLPRKPAAKPSVLLPMIILAGLAFLAYIAVDKSITSFRSGWQRSDTTRPDHPAGQGQRYDFQNQPIPAPFSNVKSTWESIKASLPVLATSTVTDNSGIE